MIVPRQSLNMYYVIILQRQTSKRYRTITTLRVSNQIKSGFSRAAIRKSIFSFRHDYERSAIVLLCENKKQSYSGRDKQRRTICVAARRD